MRVCEFVGEQVVLLQIAQQHPFNSNCDFLLRKLNKIHFSLISRYSPFVMYTALAQFVRKTIHIEIANQAYNHIIK